MSTDGLENVSDNSIDERELEQVHYNAGHLIRRCHQIAVGMFMEAYRETGLTPVQLSILLVVKQRPGIDRKIFPLWRTEAKNPVSLPWADSEKRVSINTDNLRL